MSTCQKEAYTTSSSLLSSSVPKSRTASGMSATDGMGRRNSMVEAVNSRVNRELPIRMPRTMPATAAIARPSAQPCRVSRTAVQKVGWPTRSASDDPISDDVGKYSRGRTPIRGRISKSATRASSPIRPSTAEASTGGAARGGGRRCRSRGRSGPADHGRAAAHDGPASGPDCDAGQRHRLLGQGAHPAPPGPDPGSAPSRSCLCRGVRFANVCLHSERWQVIDVTSTGAQRPCRTRRGTRWTSPPRSPRPARDGNFVQSLDRGLAVIRAFDAEHPRLQLSEVARATGLTRAAARRFLLTLVQLGYVRVDGREFSLRPRVLELGYSYLSGLTLPEVAQPHLESLVGRVDESSSVSVLDGDDVVYVARVHTKRIMTVMITVGTRFPAYATSMGRVLLAGAARGRARGAPRAGRARAAHLADGRPTRARSRAGWTRCAARATRWSTRSWRRGCARRPPRSATGRAWWWRR